MSDGWLVVLVIWGIGAATVFGAAHAYNDKHRRFTERWEMVAVVLVILLLWPYFLGCWMAHDE